MDIKKHNLPASKLDSLRRSASLVTASEAYGATRFTSNGMKLWALRLIKQALQRKPIREALVNKYGRFVRRL